MKKQIRLFLFGIFFSMVCGGQGQNNSPQRTPKKNVAILIFDGVQIIDFTGPYEVFGQAGYNVFTVAESMDTITTHMKLDVIPKYGLNDHPDVDILVIPGGGAPHNMARDHPAIQWIVSSGERAEYIISVCNGAFFLASAGMLRGKEVTTYAPMINHITMYEPDAVPVYDKRFVQSGKIVTAGGLSAGFDASLHVVSLDKGKGRAREVANNLEYNWDENSSYVRSQLADMQLANVLDFNPPLIGREVIRYEGDKNYWKCNYKVSRNETLKGFYDQFDRGAIMYGWIKEEEVVTDRSILTKWSFTDYQDRDWICETQFLTISDSMKYNLIIELKRK